MSDIASDFDGTIIVNAKTGTDCDNSPAPVDVDMLCALFRNSMQFAENDGVTRIAKYRICKSMKKGAA